uniref:Uncharacterized protein n=1 Tax=Athene cunicularia TaxID=194338 RepID=A0A663MZB8_ATHCN
DHPCKLCSWAETCSTASAPSPAAHLWVGQKEEVLLCLHFYRGGAFCSTNFILSCSKTSYYVAPNSDSPLKGRGAEQQE